MKPTSKQIDNAVATYNKARKSTGHLRGLAAVLRRYSRGEPSREQIDAADEAYATKRDAERWDGPPWGLCGRANHRAGIRAALCTLPRYS